MAANDPVLNDDRTASEWFTCIRRPLNSNLNILLILNSIEMNFHWIIYPISTSFTNSQYITYGKYFVLEADEFVHILQCGDGEHKLVQCRINESSHRTVGETLNTIKWIHRLILCRSVTVSAMRVSLILIKQQLLRWFLFGSLFTLSMLLMHCIGWLIQAIGNREQWKCVHLLIFYSSYLNSPLAFCSP